MKYNQSGKVIDYISIVFFSIRNSNNHNSSWFFRTIPQMSPINSPTTLISQPKNVHLSLVRNITCF